MAILKIKNASGQWEEILALKGEKGDKGDKGNTGNTGPTGPEGKAATITIGTVTTGAAGSSATVTNVGTSNAAKLNFTIPQGAKGNTGNTGATPNITFKVTTLDPGSSATVSKSGTAEAPVVTIGIPRGNPGEGTVKTVNNINPDSNGNISLSSISTATTANNLKLNPTIKWTVGGYGVQLRQSGSSDSTALSVVTYTDTNFSTTKNFYTLIDASGNFLPQYAKLTGATFTGAINAPTVNVTSDKRLKSDFNSINSSQALSKVLSITPMSYKLNNDSFEGRRLGVIAQEVLDIVPEVVKKNANGYYSVDYQGLCALCISTIQELHSNITELKSKIEQLENISSLSN